MTRRNNTVFRPDLTSHQDMVAAIRDALNAEALYPLSDTDVVKVAIEKMFKRAFPEKQVVRKPRKMYIPVNF